VLTFVLHTALAFTTTPILWVILRTLIPFALGMFLSIPFSLPAEVYPETYGQKVGLVSAALAAGIVIGSYGGGLLYSAGLEVLAVMLAGIFAVVGAILIAVSVPNRKAENVKLDIPGVISLFVFLTALCLVLSFMATWGYTSIPSIIGYVVTIVSAIVLFLVEKKAESPCLPFKLFKNKIYLFLALFGFFSSMYQYVIQVYTPMFGQSVLGMTTAQTGSWQIPRTIVCIVAPILFAAILKKSPAQYKLNCLLSSICSIICFAILLIPGLGTGTIMIIIALAITGIGEGLKGISTNPLAITTLEPQNIGIGIGLMSAMGSIGAQVSAAILGVVFNANTANGIQAGVFSTYISMIIFTAISVLFIAIVKIPKAPKVEG